MVAGNTAKTTSVQAEAARWSFKTKGDRVVEFSGVFARSASAQAFATTRFLHRSRMTNTSDQPRRPEEFSDAYVVRLSEQAGDNIVKFQEWALKHSLVPQLEEKLMQQEQDALMKEHTARERFALAFKPAPQRFVRDLLQHTSWELAETGYGGVNDKALVMETDSPQLAFQAGLYMRRQGYMDDTQFTYLNQDIRQQLKSPQKDHMFRLAVAGPQIEHFETEFPAAGEPKAGPDAQRMQKLRELSGSGPDSHGR